MKNKKLIGLLIGLVCLAVILILVLVQCSGGEKPAPNTEPQITTTEPETTAPDITEATTTEPEATEEETTEPETTEPEVTQPSGTQKPSDSNGTGGGYNPGDPETTEPEATEPPIEVPEAGSEQNAYYEVATQKTASITTVKIPGGGQIHYKLQAAGSYLLIQDGDVAITLDGTTYEPEDGTLKMELPGDVEKVLSLCIANRGKEETAFTLNLQDAQGTKDNPIAAAPGTVSGKTENGQIGGVYYSITPEYTGIFKLNLRSVSPEGVKVNVTVTASGAEQKLENCTDGSLEIPITNLTPILIGIEAVADEDGAIPAFEFEMDCCIAKIMTWNVADIPETKASEQIGAGESIYYDITGVAGEELTIQSDKVCVIYGDERYEPVDGQIRVPFVYNDVDQTDRIEIRNDSETALSVSMEAIHPLGHKLNPEILTELDEHIALSKPGIPSYYMCYTAQADGIVCFVLWDDPTVSGATAEIELVNDTQDITAKLSESTDGSVTVNVKSGDQVTIHVFVADEQGQTIADTVTVKGELRGTQENPILVQAPGFTAEVPAGKTIYYGGYSLQNLILEIPGEGITVTYNDTVYTPVDGVIRIQFTDDSDLVVFGIQNNTILSDPYEAQILYPAGHVNNPAPLVIGTNTVTQAKANTDDYCYGFTAPRDGMLILTFDKDGQWIYTVNNLTRDEYGDTQYSDFDEPQPKTSLTVQAGDEIQVLVNTYDKDDPWSTPAGQVEFLAEYVTGPIEVPEVTTGTEAELLAGETMMFHTSLYDHVLLIKKGTGFAVTYNGTEYLPDEEGKIRLEFAASGTEEGFSFAIRNTGAETATCTFIVSKKTAGSQDNPIIAQLGSNAVSQVAGGDNLYYSYTLPVKKVTITNTSDIYLVVWANGLKNILAPGQSCNLTGKIGSLRPIIVNTYDSANPDVAPAGTGSFTITA